MNNSNDNRHEKLHHFKPMESQELAGAIEGIEKGVISLYNSLRKEKPRLFVVPKPVQEARPAFIPSVMQPATLPNFTPLPEQPRPVPPPNLNLQPAPLATVAEAQPVQSNTTDPMGTLLVPHDNEEKAKVSGDGIDMAAVQSVIESEAKSAQEMAASNKYDIASVTEMPLRTEAPASMAEPPAPDNGQPAEIYNLEDKRLAVDRIYREAA